MNGVSGGEKAHALKKGGHLVKRQKNRQKTKNGKMEKGITPPVPQYQPHCPEGIQPPLTEERKDFD